MSGKGLEKAWTFIFKIAQEPFLKHILLQFE